MTKRRYDAITGELGVCVIYRDAELNEYSVVPQWVDNAKEREACTYYTTDKTDAIESARLMANYRTAMPRRTLYGEES
jgi:hypothetical protein